ncbi:ankyrin repeat-containing domain protein [Penicillium maclennaniae]|uniref:ankyrin repeat-containing domain protein n=1 Tax=Penicillium maclennaniae TaxID=1343394 RepID=UPI00253F7CC8|nr:ankyrin repeat-containing domain protein [Penicillium maclennaniae]KAJ5681781.1 ankyrin repeat-containing domain protein [Penicillium maclennaniae]
MKNLVGDGHDINALHEGCHILHYYDFTNEHFESLVGLGIDINGRDAYGQTLFLRAIRENFQPQRIWEAESNEEPDGEGGGELYSSAERAEKFAEDHLGMIQEALLWPDIDINASDRRGMTPLHAVIIHDCFYADILLEMLMTHEDLELNPQDELGRTPLTLAIHWGKEQMTRTLLSKPGVSIETARIQGENPLINATRQGWTDLVFSMLYRLDSIDQFSDDSGRNILHWAIIVGMMDVFELALKKSPNLLAVPDKNAMTPLHYSAQEGEHRATEILLSYGASPTARASFGQTPLHLAAAKGYTRIMKVLVAYLPTPCAINQSDSMGWTALHRAVVSGNDVLVNYLTSLQSVDLAKADRHGRAAVAFAASFASLTTLNILLEASARDRTIRGQQADIFCIDAFGNSLLHLAARANNESTLDFLVMMIPRTGNRPNKWGRAARDLISSELSLPLSLQLKLNTYGLQNCAHFSTLKHHCCLDAIEKPERPFHFDWKIIRHENTPGIIRIEETVAEVSESEDDEPTITPFSFSADGICFDPVR